MKTTQKMDKQAKKLTKPLRKVEGSEIIYIQVSLISQKMKSILPNPPGLHFYPAPFSLSSCAPRRAQSIVQRARLGSRIFRGCTVNGRSSDSARLALRAVLEFEKSNTNGVTCVGIPSPRGLSLQRGQYREDTGVSSRCLKSQRDQHPAQEMVSLIRDHLPVFLVPRGRLRSPSQKLRKVDLTSDSP